MDAKDADRAALLIARHLKGKRVSFASIPTPRASPFFEKCWRACRSIPAGQTRTYGWLAAAAGSPSAVRAAGQAMRRNPLPVIVPCHRVVASTGLGGFAGSDNPRGGTLKLKVWLLKREGWRESNAQASGRPPSRIASRTAAKR